MVTLPAPIAAFGWTLLEHALVPAQVAVGDPSQPLSFVLLASGAVVMAATLLFVAYLVVGMIVELLGGTMWTPGRGQWRQG
ncbi:MAG: hypothetical protein ABEJ28_08440 [Salinigranum sp.]